MAFDEIGEVLRELWELAGLAVLDADRDELLDGSDDRECDVVGQGRN